MTEQIGVATATAHDFMMVRAELVRALGGAQEALVFTMIDFRTAERFMGSYERDGRRWWRVRLTELADATGLSRDQAKRTLTRLEREGFVEVAMHQAEGPYDRTRSYSANVQKPVAESPLPRGGIAPSTRGGIAPSSSYEELKEHSADAEGMFELKDEKPKVDLFAEFWAHWPRKIAKRQAVKAWDSAMKRGADPAAVVRAAEVYAAGPLPEDQRFIPHASTWLNGDRWEDVDTSTPAEEEDPFIAASRRSRDLWLQQRGVELAVFERLRVKYGHSDAVRIIDAGRAHEMDPGL